MIRYALFLGLVMGSTASALAHVQPDNRSAQIDQVIYIGEDAEVAMAEPLILQKCAVEDCSDTPQN